jgi:hypothetical protein
VSQYHRSGKHYVEFRAIGERRWLNMKKIAFYIVERPNYQSSSSNQGEFKEAETSEKNDGLAPLEVKTNISIIFLIKLFLKNKFSLLG